MFPSRSSSTYAGRAFALLAAVAISGCGYAAQPRVDGLAPSVLHAAAVERGIHTRLKHLVIIVQENRSFDNLFAGWPGADS